jgi:hypothetical protein
MSVGTVYVIQCGEYDKIGRTSHLARGLASRHRTASHAAECSGSWR